MTDNAVKTLIEEHNKMIDKFINEELPKQLNVVNGKISMNDWFKANQITKEQHFYEKGMKILKACRKYGYDVKMDMQSDKLVLH